jgi:predicted small metal-binding protein
MQHMTAVAMGKAPSLNSFPDREANMARLLIDCRDYPSEMNCTVAISADSKKELVDAALQHAVAVHRHQDTPELREQIEKLIKTE